MIRVLFFVFSILSAFSLSTAFGQEVRSHSVGQCFLESSSVSVDVVMLYDNSGLTAAELNIEDYTGTIANGIETIPVEMHEYAYEEIDSNAIIAYIVKQFPVDRNQVDRVVFYGNDLDKGFANGLLAFYNGANELVIGFYVVDGNKGAYCIPPDDASLN